MRRIKDRKYNRGADMVDTSRVTHRIKVGWKTKSKTGAEIPMSIDGFVLARNSKGQDGRFEIDFDMMARLGCQRKTVEAAIATRQRGTSGLPKSLRFMLLNDARWDGESGAWDFRSIFGESYQCYDKQGLFCSGNGSTAQRRQENGTKATIICRPYGVDGCDPTEYCQFSGPGRDKPCRYTSQLVVTLLDAANNALDPAHGINTRFVFETHGEIAGMEALRELDAAANRLRGCLTAVVGTLSFQWRERRTGSTGAESKAILPHVLFALDEQSIIAKEYYLNGKSDRAEALAYAARAMQALPGPSHEPLAIEAPVAASPAPAIAAPVAEPEPPAEPEQDAQPENLDADPAVEYATAEQVARIEELAVDCRVDLDPIIRKAGVDCLEKLTLEQAQQTLDWLRRKSRSGNGGCK